MSYLTSAIFTNPAAVFSDHHQPSVSIPAVGSMTAGPGLDWGAHLWCSPGPPRAEPKHKHDSPSQNAIFQIFADCKTDLQQCNKSKSNYSCFL